MEGNLFDLRRDYKMSELSEESISDNPYEVFIEWMNHAIQFEITDPTAMILATSGSDQKVSARVVLLKKADETGFYYFTNYASKKGRQLIENPNAALLFYWPELERQIRIEGVVKMVNAEISDEYFLSRPHESQISAIISPQSQTIIDRKFIVEKASQYVSEKNKPKLERPENWGGYCLIPNLFEFWQGREHRLHDRIEFRFLNNLWQKQRLAP